MARLLWVLVILLVMAGFTSLMSRYYLGHDRLLGLVPLFDVDREASIPTLFSTLLMLIVAIILGLIAMVRKKEQRAAGLWFLLAFIFLFLAVDEFSSIHERLNRPVRELLDTSGVFLFAWVIPYALLVLVLSVVYGRFVLALPARVQRLVVLAFTVYIVGAIGFEMVGALYYETNNERMDFNYGLITLCEEFMEMAGLVVFIYALLVYMETMHNGITIQIGVKRPDC